MAHDRPDHPGRVRLYGVVWHPGRLQQPGSPGAVYLLGVLRPVLFDDPLYGPQAIRDAQQANQAPGDREDR